MFVVEILAVYWEDKTSFMEQNLSWGTNSFSASQEIPRILWNPKVHYRIYRGSPAALILSQINPNYFPIPLLKYLF
jgi:nitrous oxidase accessory protein NosD